MKMLDSFSGNKGGLWPYWQAILAGLLWIVMASAMIVESDSYRYATIILVVAALIGMRDHVRMVSHNWLAILCYAWATYVLVRFLYGLLVWGEKGTSEWLYVFPVFFPFVGVTLHATRRYLYGTATLFLALSLLALLFSLDIPTLLSGSRAAPLFHNNPIHAGVGCGMIFLCAVFWLLHSLETGKLRGRWKWPMIALGFATATASLLGALGAQSKGVWLALVITIAFLGLFCLVYGSGKSRLVLLGVLAFFALSVSTTAYPYVEKVAGRTIKALIVLADIGTSADTFSSAIQTSIESPDTPSSTTARLKLAYNAIELIKQSPWIGFGNLWLSEWKNRTYNDINFSLLHNGYFEIMVRHGIMGIAVLLAFSSGAASTVARAHKNGNISSSTAVFIFSTAVYFFSTMATNSNNRLAIGESFLILMGAVVFCLSLSNSAAVSSSEKPSTKP
jgi:O-antigen ligase